MAKDPNVKGGRVLKAVITGVGIVGWPCSGMPFEKKSLDSQIKKDSQEEEEMSVLKDALKVLGLALAADETQKSTADTEAETTETTTQAATQDAQEAFKALVAPLEEKVNGFEAVLKSLTDGQAETNKTQGQLVEAIGLIAKAIDENKAAATQAQESVETLKGTVGEVNQTVEKIAGKRPANSDLGTGNAAPVKKGQLSRELTATEKMYMNSPIGMAAVKSVKMFK